MENNDHLILTLNNNHLILMKLNTKKNDDLILKKIC